MNAHASNPPSKNPGKQRLFFALQPEGDVRAALAAEGGKAAQRCGGRILRPESLHFTLLFLGEVPTEKMREVYAWGDAVTCPPFDLTVDAHSSFRDGKVAWLGCRDPSPGLLRLEQQLGENASRGGFQRADNFIPHLTVARDCRYFPPAGPIENEIRWHVNQFALLRSDPLKGAGYTMLEYWNLRPAE